jgi:hypothetical protein
MREEIGNGRDGARAKKSWPGWGRSGEPGQDFFTAVQAMDKRKKEQ